MGSQFIQHLTKLVSLKDIESNSITNKTLKKLTNLEVLEIRADPEDAHPVKDSGIMALKKLRKLIITGTPNITQNIVYNCSMNLHVLKIDQDLLPED